MKQENGYFQIEWQQNEAICHIYPADGGSPLDYKMLSYFLDGHGFTNYPSKLLNDAILSGQETTVSLGIGDGIEFSESFDADISLDKMEAVFVLYPSSKNGKRVNPRDIISGLNNRGITFGILQNVIMELMTSPVYCTEIVIAKGMEPQHGTDAWIEYFFNTEINAKPTYNEDGTVDFHQLSNVISHIEKGDLLARLHPEDRGKPGKDVMGKESLPRTVKGKRLQVGKNIRLSEDGMEAFSEVTGHARVYNEQIFVSDVYEVPADVDNSTGNIDYKGNVYIKGSVREGFTVFAEGDIVVDGTIEGALVQAGGQVIVKRGINGMNKGVVEAQGNILCKFIENAKVFSNGYVETGAIIHSEVTATSDIIVSNSKGFITGGIIKSGGKVEAQTIGSNMCAATRIEIGADPEKKQQVLELQNEMKKIEEQNAKIAPVIKTYADLLKKGGQLDEKNKTYYAQLLNAMKSNSEKLGDLSVELELKMNKLGDYRNSKITARKDVFPGVTVVCAEVTYTFREKRSFCQIERKGADIVVSNL